MFARRHRITLGLAVAALVAVLTVTLRPHDSSSLVSSFLSLRPSSFAPSVTPGRPQELPYTHQSIIADLNARIDDWEARPVLSRAAAEAGNRYACPLGTYARNEFFFNQMYTHEWENGWDVQRVQDVRDRAIAFLREWAATTDGSTFGVGQTPVKGIVTAGGNDDTFRRILITLRLLRHHYNCTLPFEVWRFPDELPEPDVEREFRALGATFHDIHVPKVWGKAWQIKSISLLNTRFSEVLFLDGDNFPAYNPEDLFNSVEYNEHGVVVWPDLSKHHPHNAVWRVLGMTCSDQVWGAETGQLMINKRANHGLNIAALALATHMQDDLDNWMHMSYGDKETFVYAFLALHLPYSQPPEWMSVLGGHLVEADKDPYYCSTTMLQYALTPYSHAGDPSFRPTPAFVHANLIKGNSYTWANQIPFSHVKRAKLNDINEPALRRVTLEFRFPCTWMELIGAAEEGDGQDVLYESVEDAWGGYMARWMEAWRRHGGFDGLPGGWAGSQVVDEPY